MVRHNIRAAAALILALALCVPGAQAAETATARIAAGALMPGPLPGLEDAPLAIVAAPGLPVVAPGARDPAAIRLARLVASGRAAGLDGVVYDNRDRGHSALDPDRFPALAHLSYGDDLSETMQDFGLAHRLRFDRPVIGNSSTAVTHAGRQRSQPNLAMVVPGTAARVAALYAANHLYVYPEHRDHDATDRLPALWPYTVISQGSSGSDRPVLDALMLAAGAFTPQTRARIEEEGLFAPTLQMVLRRSLAEGDGAEAYRAASAHPVVVDRARLDPLRMVEIAQSLASEAIPPAVRLDVLAESFGEDAGLAGASERLFDTDGAIARVWRSLDGRQQMVLSAARTVDPNGRPLDFHWVLHRGDPGKVTIEPLGRGNALARVTFDWHGPGEVAREDGVAGARIDLAVFASNGVEQSAPAYVTVLLPHHQKRVYDAGRDGAPALVSVDYDAAGRGAPFDQALFWTAPWRDDFDDRAGWTRVHRDGTVRELSAAAPPVHDLMTGKDGAPTLVERRADAASGQP